MVGSGAWSCCAADEMTMRNGLSSFPVDCCCVADGVLALTKNPTLPTKAEQMDDSLKRIQQQPKALWIVKLSDRISNLGKPPHYWTPEKITAYRDEAIKIQQALGEASPLLSDRLLAKIEAYRAYL